MKVEKPKIAVAPTRTSLAALSEKTPPNLYVEKAIEQFGPEFRRLIRQGWTDEDLLEHFTEQNRNAVKELLQTLKCRENQARRARKQTKAERRLHPPREPVPHSPSVPRLPGGSAAPSAGTLSLPAPDPELRSPTGAGSNPVTRNRGISRPDPKEPTDD